jgi:hypothetical protein
MRNGKKHSAANTPTEGAPARRFGSAEGAKNELRERVTDWRDTVAREASERPGRTLALAVAAGYLVGGGVFSRLTARLVGLGVRIGLRMAVIPVVTQGLATLGENMFRQGAKDAQNVGDVDSRPENKKQLRHTETKETQSP